MTKEHTYAPKASPSKVFPEWLDLRMLTQYAAVSERTLRGWIHHPVHPLKASRVGNKILVRRSDFDLYVESHQIRSAADVGKFVNELLEGVAQ